MELYCEGEFINAYNKIALNSNQFLRTQSNLIPGAIRKWVPG